MKATAKSVMFFLEFIPWFRQLRVKMFIEGTVYEI